MNTTHLASVFLFKSTLATEKPQAWLVAPVEPYDKLKLYWGYYVRKAHSLADVLKQNTFQPDKKNFYDLIIGTSERGQCIDDVEFQPQKRENEQTNQTKNAKKKQKAEFQHVLVVFGGVRGLEYSASYDKAYKNTSDVSTIFDYYINTCPNQGSTTIRTEEAILITLSALRPKLNL